LGVCRGNRAYAILFLSFVFSLSALAQLNQNCTVSVLNRTVPVNADGSWVLPNIPANFGQVKARATCIQNGVTIFGESGFFTIPANQAVNLPAITLGATTPIPVSLAIATSGSPLTSAGQTVQLVVTATYPDGSTKDVSAASAGTNYTISNSAIATIAAGGLVTAVSSGTVVIQANNDGATGIATVPVAFGGATLCGGLVPASWFTTNHLNPADPLACAEDPDRDGLTNLQEFQAGTNPHNPDTDGDGLSDGDEVNKYHSKPTLADTDGDLIPDGVEVQTGTDPADSRSYDLKKATATSTVTPPSFTLTTSIANPVVSVQLHWKVTLIDGKTTLDLITSDRRTSVSSSDVNVCGLGVSAGLVFSVNTGSCVITISQNTLSVAVPGTVTAFAPTEISTLIVPGAVAVDVAGNFAYVAAGTDGLVVVDVTDRTNPRTRGTLGAIGNAQAVRASGQTVFIADANGFLRVAQAQNPDAPALISSLAIPGAPASLAVHGNMAAIAIQSGGVSLVNVADPANPRLIASFSTPGSALGVDFDPHSGLAAIAMGTSGLQLADISNPASPKLRGVLAGGDVRRVLLRLPAALLADVQRSVTAVDVTNPDQPAISTSLPSSQSGIPVDIAAFGNIAITADISFGRAVPIINIGNPLTPVQITYWTLLSAGVSSSIAVDISFGYLIVPAINTLRILKYQDIVDTSGVPPTISITSPPSGTPLIQGQTITLSATATDDVAVASVNFLVNGQVVSTTSAQPYQVSYTVPVTATTLTFGATAVDYGSNVGTAQNVVVSVIPDPLTTVKGQVLTTAGIAVSGATVSALGISGSTASGGTFSLPGVPTIRGPIIVDATGIVAGVKLVGSSALTPPVTGGITNVGIIQVRPRPLLTSIVPKSALAGTTVASMVVNGANLAGSTFTFSPASAIVITNTTIAADGNSATLSLNIPGTAIGTFALVASNDAGNSGTDVTQPDRFTAVDPNSTADTDGDGFQDAIEAVFGTDPLDPASFPVIPAATETESVAFSILNAPVTAAGITETESVAFSILNAPITGAGITETESVAFSLLNAPAGTAGIVEAESYFSVLNNFVPSSSETARKPSKQAAEKRSSATQSAVLPPPVDPFLDSDGDGLPDWYELLIGTDPDNPDTDGDGLSDFDEIFTYRTNPLLADTDGDGFTDGEEVAFGSDPLNPESTPLNIRRRANAVHPAANEVAIVADNSTNTNLNVKGDAHVNASQKTGLAKAPAIGRFLNRFAPHRTGR